MSLKELDFLILDVQTTGFVPQYCDIVELAWMKGSGRSQKAEKAQAFTLSLPEGKQLTRKIREITGLGDEDFKDALSLNEVGLKLSDEVAKELPILSHYARFEKSFLIHHLGNLFHEEQDFLCTFEIAKRLYPDLPCRNLPALAGYFGYPHMGKKRALSHVEATHQVWRSLVGELENQLSITELSDLREWLKEKSPKGSKKMQFQISKEIRDAVPQAPGVYRFLNQHDEILYIGKAINLKQRLKSYFQNSSLRGRKREMMTQASQLKYDLADNQVHAALIETDLIKKHSPPYNVALQGERRRIYFFSTDYFLYSEEQGSEYPNGPYTQPQDFSALQAMVEGDGPTRLNAFLFYGFVEEEEFTPGWDLFKSKYLTEGETTIRSLIALGIKFYRYYSRQSEEEVEQEELIEEELHEDEVPYTPEEICAKIERRLAGTAKQYLRSKEITKLLNSRVEWTEKGEKQCLNVVDGKIQMAACETEVISENSEFPWQGKGIADYDRLRVLLTELQIRVNRGEECYFIHQE